MKKLKVYLDTSIINFVFADDAPEFKSITNEFFDEFVAKKIYDVFVSEVVIAEIMKTQNEEKRLTLLGVITKYELGFVDFTEDAMNLSQMYIDENIIPKKKIDDANHIGISTVHNFDVLLSWNFKHLANLNKRNKIKIINEREGYFYPLDLVTPIQMLYYEN